MSFQFDLHTADVSDSHFPCHAPTMPFFSRPQYSTSVERSPCCAAGLSRKACSGHGMANVNQTRPHCVNQMGETHSKPLAARHGRRKTWARHGNSMLCGYRALDVVRTINPHIHCHISNTAIVLSIVVS